MKKRSLLAMTLVGTTLLAACGNKTEEPQTETTPQETPEVVEGYTGTAIRNIEGESDTTKIEVTFENGKPVDVEIDMISEDGTSKHELSSKGEYVMVEGEEMAWHEQIDALENHLVEVGFDFTKVPTIDEAGHIDAVSGVSISVSSFLTETETLIKDVEAGTYVAPEAEEVVEEETIEKTEEATTEEAAE